MNTKIYTVLFLLFIPFMLSAQQLWTLEQCVDSALENNRKVKQQSIAAQSQAIAYDQARKDLLPNLNASAGQNFSFGRTQVDYDRYENVNSQNTSFGVSANITLFNGLRMKHTIDARRADLHASEADLEKMKSDITISVTSAFLQVLMNKELLQTANEQLALTQSKLERQQALVENGKLAEGELYELIAQQAKEELNRIQADNALQLSLLDLAQILELDDFSAFDVVMPDNLEDKDLAALSAESVYASALTHRPEIKAAEYRLESSEKSVSIARAGYFPSLTLGGSVGTRYFHPSVMEQNFGTQLENNFNSGIGLNLNIPIFNKFEVKNRVRSARLDVESSKLAIEDVKLELRKTIQQAYQNAVAAKARWEAADKSEKAALEAYRFASQKYEAGRASQYELFQAKNNLTQVLSEQTQAKFEYIFRIRILEILQ